MTADSTRRRVVVLAVHPPSLAGTRLRAMQYRAGLADAGIDLQLWSFFSDSDIALWFGRTHLGRLAALLRGLCRVPAARRLARNADAVWLLRDAVPVGSCWLERWMVRGRPWVWDVDDAVWRHTSPTAGRWPTWLRATPHKYAELCRRATQVWAGSDVLAEWCRERSSSVHVVPTVVDVPSIRPIQAPGQSACWIGSHSTTPFIADVVPALLDAFSGLTVTVVGADERLLTVHPRLRILPWSGAAEQMALRSSQLGLYPVDLRHPLADGKCGLKAILYMAHGIPPIVTPTVTNAHIVRDRVDGLHAGDLASWTSAVKLLLDNDALRESLSLAGRQRAQREYSLQVWTPRVAESLARLMVAR